MLEFLKILLFAKTIVLTPLPIDLNSGHFEIGLKEPISAVTDGAALYIDVSSMLPDDVKGVVATRKWLEGEFHLGFAKAILRDSGGDNKVVLHYKGGSSWANGEVRLILSSDGGVPTNIEYDKIVIETDISLDNVLLFWKNHNK